MTPRTPTGADVLRGVRVLDLTQVWAGPHATMFLADWGAEVIRIESTHWFVGGTRGQMVHPPKEAVLLQKGYLCAYPDWEPEPNPWNKFPMFQSHARNKLSMTLDLRRPDGLEILWDLARTADVLIENNAKETMDGLGVTYDALRRVRPDIIMIRMPGYGLTGEYEEWRAFGPQMEAVAGHTSLWGYTDLDTSNRNNTFVADAGSGMTAAAAALMALLHRQRTGEGQFIELDQTENVATFLGEAFADYTMNGRVPTTLGNRHPTMAPHGAYPCAGEDEWLAVSVSTDAEWRGLCTAMGRDDLAADPRFVHRPRPLEAPGRDGRRDRGVDPHRGPRRGDAPPPGRRRPRRRRHGRAQPLRRRAHQRPRLLRDPPSRRRRRAPLSWPHVEVGGVPQPLPLAPLPSRRAQRLRLRRAPRPRRRRDASPRSRRPHRHRIRPRARPTLTGPGRGSYPPLPLGEGWGEGGGRRGPRVLAEARPPSYAKVSWGRLREAAAAYERPFTLPHESQYVTVSAGLRVVGPKR